MSQVLRPAFLESPGRLRHLADHQWLLDACRIPSENTDAIVPCLRKAADRFGAPRRVLRDLSDAIGKACQQALPGVAVSVCNYHLVRDVGEDLYGSPIPK